MYSIFGVIEPNYSNLGYALKFWWYQSALARQMGYQYFFAPVHNPIALKILKKIGAKVIDSRKIVELPNAKMDLVIIDVQEAPSFEKIVQSMLTDFKANL